MENFILCAVKSVFKTLPNIYEELKVAIYFPKLLEDLKHFIHFQIVQKNIFHPTALLSSASFTIYNSFILGYQEA